MSIKRKYQKTLVLGNEFLADTGNVYRVVAQRPYTDKNGRLPNGVVLTLQITKDLGKYRDGEDNMVMENFDAYVLSGSHDVGLQKGDYCALEGFMPDVSYYINFDYILRFDGVKKLVPKGGAAGADDPKA